MFEIHIQDPNTSSGMVAVSWCVQRELLERLHALGVKEPQVLIITSPVGDRYHESKEARRLVPLIDAMAYIEFRCDGLNRVRAVIVPNTGDSSKNWAQTELFSREGGSWATTLLNYNGDELRGSWHTGIKGGRHGYWGVTYPPGKEDDPDEWRAVESTLEVSVPAGCFAKPPAAWEQLWVNLMWRQPPIDQCDFRKRRIWAYTGQIPLMIGIWLLRLGLTLFALLAGFKKISWESVRHPLVNSTSDTLENFEGGSYFWPESWGEDGFKLIARYGLPVFSPASLLFLGTMAYLFTKGEAFTVLALLKLFVSMVTIAAVGIPIVVGVIYGVAIAWAGFTSLRAENPEVPVIPEYMDAGTVTFLSCDQLGGRPRTLQDIPRARRTVRLRFHDLKAKVCQPYSG